MEYIKKVYFSHVIKQRYAASKYRSACVIKGFQNFLILPTSYDIPQFVTSKLLQKKIKSKI